MSAFFHSATAEQIERFCEEMKKSLLAAHERWPGCVKLSAKQFVEEIVSAPAGVPIVVGHQYVGARWAAQFGEDPDRR